MWYGVRLGVFSDPTTSPKVPRGCFRSISTTVALSILTALSKVPARNGVYSERLPAPQLNEENMSLIEYARSVALTGTPSDHVIPGRSWKYHVSPPAFDQKLERAT